MPKKIVKSNYNGFYIQPESSFSGFGELDSIDDTLGFDLSSTWNSLVDKGTEALTSLAAKEVTKLASSVLPATSTLNNTVQTYTQAPPITTTTVVNQPIDPNIKLALWAGGALIGSLLLITVIKQIGK